MLIRLYQIVGPKWTVIAKNFRTRTPENIKNRHTQLQRLSRFNPPTPSVRPPQSSPSWPSASPLTFTTQARA